MKKIILFMLILVLGINIATAKDHRRNRKICKSYKCKHIGIQKISSNQTKPKHYFIKPIRHFGHITNYKHTPKFRG